jgi:hypothetical protein
MIVAHGRRLTCWNLRKPGLVVAVVARVQSSVRRGGRRRQEALSRQPSWRPLAVHVVRVVTHSNFLKRQQTPSECRVKDTCGIGEYDSCVF